MVTDWISGGLSHCWCQNLQYGSQLYVILDLYPNFCSLALMELHQEHSHTWRTLMVPDWSFEWFSQLCCV